MKHTAISTRKELFDRTCLESVVSFLSEQKKEVFLSKEATKNFNGEANLFSYSKKEKPIDILIVIGGDGTILREVQRLQRLDTPIFGINAGKTGFLSSIHPEKSLSALQEIFDGKYSLDERMLLHITVKKSKGKKQEFHALNEAVIHHSGIARLREVVVKANDQDLTKYRADGLIISTPTGSTAYNLAAGGPILHPKVPAFILTPIAPSSFGQKSIVLPTEKTLSFYIPKGEEDMMLSIDGQKSITITDEDSIEITKHAKNIRFIRLQSESYFKTIRQKLGWGHP
jgi:NAD+ kinase